ncbi:Lrp/AsnC family transcriptional regulator [Halegenticoccus soli]|uniref:Lrp/AsnC family transcriptional regulator n=1 Tax=Halegenticoccus soli TaxID=1985678 RepID=UPI000C6E47A8|nr:Lrp/AsnC family transcriptional regulator [Halegenticoccus soli]
MPSAELDEVDRGILHVLQQDARRITTQEIGEKVDVSASTVRNRIGTLERSGVIRGYHPNINYERAGYQLHLLFMCAAPATDREKLAREATGVKGVVRVDEIVGSEQNILVEAVAADTDQLGETHDGLAELGLTIAHSNIFRNRYVQPFNHFGIDRATD